MTMPDDARRPDNPAESLTENDLGKLRDILGFPEAVATTDNRSRRAGHREQDEPPAPTPSLPNLPAARSDDDLGRRLEHLSVRVEAVAGLVETLFDRVVAPGGSGVEALTADELADIAAQIVRIIEARLETQSEHFDRVVAELGDRPALSSESDAPGPGLRTIDERLAMLGRAVLEIKQSLSELPPPSSDMQEIAIVSHLDRAFEEMGALHAAQTEQQRLDVQRLDHAVNEMAARMIEVPDRQALRDLYQTLSQQFFQAQLSMRDDLNELQTTVTTLPEKVAMQQPIGRLDATILQQLDLRLAETSEGLAQKMDDQLAARVQRFEALSQAMMTLVGDPVDSLSSRLADLLRAQGNPHVLQAIGELTQIQAQLASALASMRQDGLERDALLREALEKLDRLSGEVRDRRPQPGDPPASLFS
jgi:hypothetical protein